MAVKFIMPEHVSEETAKFMRDVLKELNKNKAVQNIDLGALNMLAVSYEMYLRATALLLSEGTVVANKYGDYVPHPAQAIASKNYVQVMKIMTEYGLTIKSRMKMQGATSDKTDIPLMDFYKGKEFR